MAKKVIVKDAKVCVDREGVKTGATICLLAFAVGYGVGKKAAIAEVGSKILKAVTKAMSKGGGTETVTVDTNTLS